MRNKRCSLGYFLEHNKEDVTRNPLHPLDMVCVTKIDIGLSLGDMLAIIAEKTKCTMQKRGTILLVLRL